MSVIVGHRGPPEGSEIEGSRSGGDEQWAIVLDHRGGARLAKDVDSFLKLAELVFSLDDPQFDLPTEERWRANSLRQKMEEGLGEMTHFMVILTPTSITKPWVAREIDVGLVRLVGGKSRMMPLRVGVEVSDLSPFLQTLLCEAIAPSAEADLAALVDRLHDVSRKPALGPKPRYVETVPSGVEGWSPSAIAISQLLAEKSEHATSFDPMMPPHEIAEATGIAPADVRQGILDLDRMPFYRS